MKTRIALALSFSLLLSSGCTVPQAPVETSRSAHLQTTLAAQATPMAVFITGESVSRRQGAAAGLADADSGQRLTIDTPLRIASNTKMFVAATVLRLWEQKRIDLDAPISPLLTPVLDQLLKADGYATDRITVRQLLSHSAGLYDHGSDPRYVKAVLADPGHIWTREEQIRLMTTYADPQSQPGTEFKYSDDDYILLGDIVERITGKELAAAVRSELRLDRLGLRSTWWEVMEAPPTGAAKRARQFLGDTEATNVHASMDLYGGGGLVMSTRDLATFTAALFEGRIFDQPETLREMLWKGPHQGADQYRLGVFVKHVGDHDLYWHSGFWGTFACYSPSTGVAAAGVTTNQDAFKAMRAIVEDAVEAAAPAHSSDTARALVPADAG